MDSILILRKIQVEGANAIAGLTWGFPAITNFLGFSHALERSLPNDLNINITACGIVCHEHHVHAYRGDRGDTAFSLTRNPLDKSGKSASIVEEGKMRLCISLILAIEEEDELTSTESKTLKVLVEEQVQRQRLAGGLVVNQPEVEYFKIESVQDHHRKHMRRLLPGYALVNRHDLLQAEQKFFTEQGIDDPEFNTWLHSCALNYSAKSNTESDEVEWTIDSKPGWIIPLTIGYRPISKVYDAGEVAKARDPETPFCFVENLYSLGQWISPHRITDIEQLFWHYEVNDAGDYLCVNHFEPNITA